VAGGGESAASLEERPHVRAELLATLLDASGEPDWVVGFWCHIHPSTISRYRHGIRAVTRKHAEVLAEYLGISLEEVDPELGGGGI